MVNFFSFINFIYLFDASFEGIPHECPYQDINEMFDLTQLEKVLSKI